MDDSRIVASIFLEIKQGNWVSFVTYVLGYLDLQ